MTDARASRILVLGGTGYIGSGVMRALRAAGYDAVATSRRADSADSADTVRADAHDVDSVVAAVKEVAPDAVVHAAAFDLAAESVVIPALLDLGLPTLYTSGIWWLGDVEGSPFEEAPPHGDTPRARVERLLVDASDRVHTVVIRPAVVHGRGGGIVTDLVDGARTHGIGRYVGRPGVRWPLVHVDDLGDLFVRALTHAPSGSVLHGVTEPGTPVSEIAAAADRAAGGAGRAEPWPVEEAAPVIGEAYAGWLALEQVFSSVHTRVLCDWHPSRPTLVTELLTGQYSA